MKKSLLTLSAVAALFTAQAAFAQDTTKSRAEVKKEAASAVKGGEIAKGEGPAKTAPAKSVKARAEVKKEAAAAVKAGEVAKGEGPAPAKK